MPSLLEHARTRPQRRAPITSATRARHARADDAAAALSTIKDGITLDFAPRDSRRYALTELQRTYSLRRAVQRCRQGGRRCMSALCAGCAGARHGQYRRQLYDSLTAHTGTMVAWTATVATPPGTGVRQQYTALIDVLTATTRGGWLARQGITGTVRSVEIEHSDDGGFHVHAHHLLVFRNEISAEGLQRFALTLDHRYRSEGCRLGITAATEGQDIAVVRSPRAWGRYMAKGRIREGGSDALSRLWAAVRDGDADALSAVHEIESGAFRRRLWTTTGVCRPVPDLDEMIRAGKV